MTNVWQQHKRYRIHPTTTSSASSSSSSLTTATTSALATMEYILVEEGIIPNSSTSSLSLQERAIRGTSSGGMAPSAVATTGSKFHRYVVRTTPGGQPVTVAQWTEQLQSNRRAVELFNAVLANAPYEAFYWETKPVRGIMSASLQEMEFVIVDAPALVHSARNTPDEQAFAEHFRMNNNNNHNLNQDGVVVFPNLGRDALLIVPTNQYDDTPSNESSDATTITAETAVKSKVSSASSTSSSTKTTNATIRAYSDLAMFARHGPINQIIAIWQRVAVEYQNQWQSSTKINKKNKNQTLKQKGTLEDEQQAPAVVWLSTCGTGVAWLHIRLDSRPKYYTYTPYKNNPME